MTNYRRGTNQYAKKGKKDIGAYMIAFIYLMSLMVLMYDISLHFPTSIEASENISAPVGITQTADPAESQQVVETKVSTPAEIPSDPTPTQTEIESYIKTIFGRDAKTAIAVSRNECGPTNKNYPSCQFHTAHENSIGLFQINLMSQYAKVHYDRVPGETLEEKIEWLKDPHNNVLMAYWIYSHSGWYPWTAYTSGNYLKDM